MFHNKTILNKDKTSINSFEQYTNISLLNDLSSNVVVFNRLDHGSSSLQFCLGSDKATST